MNMDRGRSEENSMQQQDQQLPARPPEAADDHHHHQPPPPHKCPRCDSFNTKFCYYNNYSLSQPRYFCKACRRYWTQGGTLRNVPVGGGCRKSKRARTSSSSLSNSLTARTQGLSPAVRPQNLTGVVSGQPSRPMPPVIPPMGNSFYTGGSFLSSLAAMHSLPGGGINQGAAVNLGGGSSQFGANMALLQGVSLPSLKSPAPPHQFQPPTTHYFPPQPSLIPPGPFSSWSPGLINTGGASSSSAVTSSFWSCNAGGGNDQAGSSFASNQWSDSHPGFNPSQ